MDAADDTGLDDDSPNAGQTPESLHYHDQERRCDMCQHFGPANECSVLKQPVSPQGACDAFETFEAGESGDDTDGDFDDSGEESFAPVAGGYDS
jgi:hypothetical protein